MNASIGDVIFIIFICGVIAGIMGLVNRSRRKFPANPPSIPDEILGDEMLRHLLSDFHHVAVIGPGEEEDLRVCHFLHAREFKVYFVNPTARGLQQESGWRGLETLPHRPEMIVICPGTKSPEQWVQSALEQGVAAVWMEKTVVSADAMEIARSRGIPLVMNLSLIDEYSRLLEE